MPSGITLGVVLAWKVSSYESLTKLDQERCAGAGPGGSISGSSVSLRTRWRVTKKTAAVQLGNGARPGTSSAKKVGRKAQCQPKRRASTAAAAKSTAAPNGERPPGANPGIARTSIASTPIAPIH